MISSFSSLDVFTNLTFLTLSCILFVKKNRVCFSIILLEGALLVSDRDFGEEPFSSVARKTVCRAQRLFQL